MHRKRERFLIFRALVLVVVVPALLVLAVAACSLQGYTDDLGSKPVQSWPFGVAALLLAGTLVWLAVRSRPTGK